MTERERLMQEDRAMRDAARGLVAGDLDRVRGSLAERSLGERALGRAQDGTAEIVDELTGFARSHKGGLAAGVGLAVAAAVGWMFRDRIADAVNNLMQASENSSADAISEDGTAEPAMAGEQEHMQ